MEAGKLTVVRRSQVRQGFQADPECPCVASPEPMRRRFRRAEAGTQWTSVAGADKAAVRSTFLDCLKSQLYISSVRMMFANWLWPQLS